MTPDASERDATEADASRDSGESADVSKDARQYAAPIKIMPLGDSITDGVPFPGGYRIRLWEHAVADAYAIDFVGSLQNGPKQLGDHDNEGHNGFRVDQVEASIATWIDATHPDVVLMMLGTNDIAQDFEFGTAPARLEQLVRHISELAPQAEIFLASVTPLLSKDYENRALTYNAEVARIAGALSEAGIRVRFVDMHAALTLEDLADGVHPNEIGYAKMGDVWYQAILPLLRH